MRTGVFTQIKNTGKTAMLSVLLVLGSAAFHPAFPEEFTRGEIEKTAQAYLEVLKIREAYLQEFEDVDDPEIAEKGQMEANKKIIEAVVNSGISVDTYNDVIAAALTDEALMDELLNTIDRLEKNR
ncbi:MAG: DUF4168 domain-containing protein [Desulfosalsimonadaceae bacterium]